MSRYSRPALSFVLLLLFELSGRAQSYTISTVAGPTLPQSGSPAASQTIGVPNSVVSDGAGGFFFVSETHNRVYRVRADGTLMVIAGDGNWGFSGDGGPALSARFNAPTGVAVDVAGNIFIADYGNSRIRKVNTAGIISTVAGNGTSGFAGDGALAVSARLSLPRAVAVDESGNLYIADWANHRVRKVTPAGIISTVAGNGVASFSGDGGPAISAGLGITSGVAVDGSGNLFIADLSNSRIRKVTPAGIITTVACCFASPYSVAVDGQGNIFIAEGNASRVRKVNTAGIISTAAGTTGGFAGDGGPAVFARLAGLQSAAVDASGNLFIADTNNHRIRKVNPAGVISTVAGVDDDGGLALSAQLNKPWDVAVDASGNIFIADTWEHRIRKVTADGVISTVVGNGISGTGGNGGPAVLAQIDFPTGIELDSAGNLYIASDSGIRRLNPDGVINAVVGFAIGSFNTRGIALDQSGNIFFADISSNRVLKATPGGLISVVAGDGTVGFSGDGGPALLAQLNVPWGIVVDRAGNLFIADDFNSRIRKVTPDGIITTFAGNGSLGFSGDGGPAASAQIGQPLGLAVDAEGNLFVCSQDRIRKITPAGTISTVAGNGSIGVSTGDNGPARSAGLSNPIGITVDATGNLFIAETDGNRIRKLTPIERSSLDFAIAAGGGVSKQSSGTAGASAVAGYASIQPTSGKTTPSGLAIIGFRQNNVLVTEAGVPASQAMRLGRIYAEVGNQVNTGLAIANPNNQAAIVSFHFSDVNGDFGQGTTTIAANGQIASFLNEAPFNGRSSVGGTFTFSSSIPVAVIALRGLTNQRGEFLITTLPVDDLSAGATAGPVVFPYFADGGGWTTQIVLVNRTDNDVAGTVQFLTQSGANGNSFTYSIPPRASQKLQTSGTSASIVSGSVRVTPAANSAAPSGVAIFSFRNASGVTVSEAGVPAVAAGNAFRLYAEATGDFFAIGSIQTALAVTNTSTNPATVKVEVQNLDGFFGPVGTIQLPPNGESAFFLSQVPGLASLPIPFQGTLRLSSSASISVLGLRGHYNERGDFLITTTPPINESTPPSTSTLFFPHIVDGGGYTTQFVLLSGGATLSSAGTLKFFSQSGDALTLTFK